MGVSQVDPLDATFEAGHAAAAKVVLEVCGFIIVLQDRGDSGRAMIWC